MKTKTKKLTVKNVKRSKGAVKTNVKAGARNDHFGNFKLEIEGVTAP
jgi:hypothetical protein